MRYIMESSIVTIVASLLAAISGVVASFFLTYGKYHRSINEDKIQYQKSINEFRDAQAGRDLNNIERVSTDFHQTLEHIMQFAKENNIHFMKLLEEKNRYFSERLDAISKMFDQELKFLTENFKETMARNNAEFLSLITERLRHMDEVHQQIQIIASYCGVSLELKAVK